MTDPFPPPIQRKLPPGWTARARQVAVTLEPLELVRRIASTPIRYNAIMRREQAWRIACAAAGLCAVDGCEVTGAGRLVFDHCHDHGWLRGMVCNSHNVRLGQIDAVRHIPGVRLDLSGTPYAALLVACPDCRVSDQP